MDSIKQFEPLFGTWYAEGLIGADSCGSVYKVFCDRDGKREYAAVKHLPIPQDAADVLSLRDEGMDERATAAYYASVVHDIEDEFRLMDDLAACPNLLRFDDHAIIPRTDGLGYDVFIRVDLLESLAHKARKAPLSAEETARIGIDVCTALELFERHGITHRSIDPDCIMIDRDGTAKLAYFGVSRRLKKTHASQRAKKSYKFTAPETVSGQVFGPTCDTYSLGLVLYRLVNGGRSPFMPPAPKEVTNVNKELAVRIRLSGQPIPAPCNADAELSGIILKACAFDPKDRFASASEMKAALQTYLGLTPDAPVRPAAVPAAYEAAAEHAPDADGASKAETPAADSGAKPAGGHRVEQLTWKAEEPEPAPKRTWLYVLVGALLLAAAAAALLFSGVLGKLGFGSKEPSPTDDPGFIQIVTPRPTADPTETPVPTVYVTATPEPTQTPSPETSVPTEQASETATATERPANTPANTAGQSVTPRATNTPKPTNTPNPTRTPKPTNTPKPTRTPKPTNTPKPTDAPTEAPTEEPTAAPETPAPTDAPSVQG